MVMACTRQAERKSSPKPLGCSTPKDSARSESTGSWLNPAWSPQFFNAVVIPENGTSPSTWIRHTLTELSAQDGLANPAKCGSFFSLLIDGASVRAITTGEITGIVDAKQAATEIINIRRNASGESS